MFAYNSSAQDNVLVIPFYELNFFAPASYNKYSDNEASTLKGYYQVYENLVNSLNTEKACGYEYQTIDVAKHNVLIENLRYSDDKKFLSTEENTLEKDWWKENFSDDEIDYYLFINRYKINSDITDRIPSNEMEIDFFTSDGSLILNDMIKASAMVNQGIPDEQKEVYLLKKMGQKFCKSLNKKMK